LPPPSSHTTGRTHRIRRFPLIVVTLRTDPTGLSSFLSQTRRYSCRGGRLAIGPSATSIGRAESQGHTELPRCFSPSFVASTARSEVCGESPSTSRRTPWPSLAVPVTTARKGLSPSRLKTCPANKKAHLARGGRPINSWIPGDARVAPLRCPILRLGQYHHNSHDTKKTTP
jgi:hypothetical protein